MLPIFYFFITFFIFSTFAHDRILIMTHAYNQPDFIKMQAKTFKKFMQDDYEFLVFNDASNDAMAQQIQQACNDCGVHCIRVPQEIHDRPYLKRGPGEPYHRPNIRHVNCCQYSLDTIGFNFDGIVGFIDSDIFLIRPLSIAQEMEGYDIMTAIRGTKALSGQEMMYFWPGLCFMRMNTLPDKRTLNFNYGNVNGASMDSGGYSYFYLQAHPDLKVKIINEVFACDLFCPDRFVPKECLKLNVPENVKIATYEKHGFTEKEIEFLLKKPDSIEFLLQNHFLHYRAGTNYDNQSKIYNDRKKKLVDDFLQEVMGN